MIAEFLKCFEVKLKITKQVCGMFYDGSFRSCLKCCHRCVKKAREKVHCAKTFRNFKLV